MLLLPLLILLGLENVLPSQPIWASEDGIFDERLEPMIEALTLNNSTTLLIKDLDIESYEATKAGISALRNHLKEGLKEGTISLDEIKTIFTDYLVDRIIPYWYGTPWSFEGHTALPKRGEIACGYFVSTTLRDMGIKLNRYKLAQQSPLDEAKTISCGSDVYSVVHESTEQAFEEIDKLAKEGVYFIGFDTGHVGYLLKRKGQMFLIHSNYFLPRSVCIEPFVDSRVFKSFSKFYLVPITDNNMLLQHWLEEGKVL
jgi:hypothetical protein